MMKLWLLTARNDLPAGDDPWEPWYNTAQGFVIRASNEYNARALAHKEAGDENHPEFLGKTKSKTKAPWLDPNYSVCIKLSSNGPEEIVLRDFAAA